jgi:hypothetical protein
MPYAPDGTVFNCLIAGAEEFSNCSSLRLDSIRCLVFENVSISLGENDVFLFGTVFALWRSGGYAFYPLYD